MSKIGDIMQGFIMSDPGRARWFLSSAPASIIEKIGKKSALGLIKEAQKKIPAYRKYLVSNKVKIDKIESLETVPTTSKEKYLDKNAMEDLILEPMAAMDIIYRSSGTTGIPFWWPQLTYKDKVMPRYFELYYSYLLELKRHSTLVVNVLDMGVWVAGMTVASNLQRVALTEKYKLTVMSPGSNIDSALEIIKRFGGFYDQILIVGYPPFIECLILEGKKTGLDWKKLRVRIQVGGEPFAERWRSKVIKELGIKESDLLGVTSVYGSSDTGSGMTGFETALSIMIKRLALKDDNLRKEIFGDEERIPTLVQNVPMSSYVEEVDGNLVLTSKSGIPLLRHDINDRGGVIPFEKMKKILNDAGYDLDGILRKYGLGEIWRLPFFYCFGRRNAVSIEGAHVYAEDVQAIIAENEIREINNYKLTIKDHDDHMMHFAILLELRENIEWSDKEIEEKTKKMHDIFMSGLISISPDYRSAYNNNPKVCDPIMHIYHYSDGPFASERGRAKHKHIL